MPELPEVETVRRQLEPQITNRKIVKAGSHWSAKFTPALEAQRREILGISRRGKYLLLSLDNDHELIVHLGMTGRLTVSHDPNLDDAYLRAWWHLDSGDTLQFHDVRRFGRIRYVLNGDYSKIPTLAAAGPEPWDKALTAEVFHERLKQSKRKLKTKLLSQRPIAGVGNIYADEALWMARNKSSDYPVGFIEVGPTAGVFALSSSKRHRQRRYHLKRLPTG